MDKQIRVKPCERWPDGVKEITGCFRCPFFCGTLFSKKNYVLDCKMFGLLPIAQAKNSSLSIDKVHEDCKLEDYGTGLPVKVEDGLPEHGSIKILQLEIGCGKQFPIAGYYDERYKIWRDSFNEDEIEYKVISWQPLPGEEGK